jgi:hypothetical protein
MFVLIIQGWKKLLRKNALAYLASSSVVKKKKFYNIDTWLDPGWYSILPNAAENLLAVI